MYRWFAVSRPALFALAVAIQASCQAAASAAEPTPYSWEARLSGRAIVLLGEVHDNESQHRSRLEVLSRAFAAGWRPVVALEQFDREHQADIEKARAERPLDAGYLIQKAAPGSDKPGTGWNWDYYRPYVELALKYHLPLLAANLSRSDATKIVEGGYSAVFGEPQLHQLGLDSQRAALLTSQEKEIDAGHCHKLPKEMLPAMARAQLARDAVMAEVLRTHAEQGVVLLAGNGHVRKDFGVSKWLAPSLLAQVFTVGFVERDNDLPPRSAFDAVVETTTADRPDPCASLGPALPHKRHGSRSIQAQTISRHALINRSSSGP